LRNQAAGSKIVFSVCTGALICGAAGLLKGKRATTHWASHDLLRLFGAVPVDARVVEDGSLVTAAGVTSGIDAALRVAAILRGDESAQMIQLYMQYAPEPPFDSGTPDSAPTTVVRVARSSMSGVLKARAEIAKRAAAKLSRW
jgi:cyclohexyl-isocyanide hydratase